MRSRLLTLTVSAASAIIATSCSSDSNSMQATSPGIGLESAPSTSDASPPVVAGQPFPDERCTANREAGTITYLTGRGDAAESSSVDVIAAQAAGYYVDLCLDVEIIHGASPSNYPAVASGSAQLASAGSFSEMVAYAAANDVPLTALTVDGRTSIDTLIVKAGTAASLSELTGTTIGVPGEMPPSIAVMLREAALVEGEDYRTTEMDGADPLVNIALPIDGWPGQKSNEVGTLDREGIGVQLFDPLDFGIPGSFGVIFATPEFVEAHPTAAQDFVRATLQGLADAVANPADASAAVVEWGAASGITSSLSTDAEHFRWGTEADLILMGTPEGVGLGVPDAAALQAELDAYSEVGYFDADTPLVATDFVDLELAAAVYEAAQLVVP